MSEKKEFWDIYDHEKNLTGRTMRRNDWTMADGDYYLSVLGVIRRPDGRFLITQRVMTKSWAAGWWEVPGGGVKAGETSFEAVCREVFEETGLDVSNADGGYQFCYHRENPGQNYIVDIYRFDMDVSEEDLVLQSDETLGGKFATANEIEELDRQGIFLHYQSIKRVFEK
ncbi:MAG: NUDIX hydrolase [Spirochaetales bacterium]|nr:NUDIX hydrolase [Spirochaetales bacterium]